MEEWVRQAQAGDAQSYRPIVEQLQQQIYVYCCRMLGHAQEAEDAAQEILIKGYNAIASYKPTVSFTSWLYAIAYHHCLNVMRRKRLQRQLMGWMRPQAAEASAEETYERKVFSEPLATALDELSVSDRSLLILHVCEERTYVEIGQITGKSPEAIRKKVMRIKARMKRVIEAWEGDEQWRVPALARTKT
ncbi:RNA polymerase sigma-70 factor (ECF subfamily) [Paenibacillus phyllosphaerae]|uniref:RNA polymerase sigma-70 factor (ECF subfamily) n=1 Tax=Paenibacillus phyllosphaerae TaxID=274593 RepID=A0A7W5B3U2_9BACL|nr:RNA polymerase sigma factor [Paenibacillus phyllosphaerae]MBB3113813.1 RNA polymerase sigma-70 factor (ECF subfamily) [Paenibacillus phyllosphaerae]